MKAILIFLVSFLQITLVFAQQNQAPNDTLKNYLSNQVEDYIDHHYLMLNQGNLNEKINSAAHQEVREWFALLIAISAVLGAVFGYLGFKSFREQKQAIKEDLSNDLSKKLKNEMEKLIQVELEKLTRELKNESNKVLQKSQEILNESFKNVIDFELRITKTDIEDRISKRDYHFDDIAIKLMELKIKIENMQGKDAKQKQLTLMPEIYTALIRIYYYESYGKNRFNPKIHQLIEEAEHQKHISLPHDAYATAAIGAIDDYYQNSNSKSRGKAIEYLEKSEQQFSGYGTAYAQILLLYIIDFERKGNETYHQEAMYKLKIYLSKILEAASNYPAYETIWRLEIDFRIYPAQIENLYRQFPGEMIEIYERAKNVKKSAFQNQDNIYARIISTNNDNQLVIDE